MNNYESTTTKYVYARGKRFIKHNGGQCPVAANTIVDVLFRDGGMAKGKCAGFWSTNRKAEGYSCWWEHKAIDENNNIVAYRVLEPEELI